MLQCPVCNLHLDTDEIEMFPDLHASIPLEDEVVDDPSEFLDDRDWDD